MSVCAKLHVAQSPQADVEEDDKGHPQVQHGRKLLWALHLAFERQNLEAKGLGKTRWKEVAIVWVEVPAGGGASWHPVP